MRRVGRIDGRLSDLERAGFRMRAMDTTTGGCDGTPPPCDATPILVGTYAPAWATFEPPAPDPVWPARRAIVILSLIHI